MGRYSIAAVVSEDSPARSLEEALGQWRKEGRGTVRVASEYVNIADHCARSRHLPRYKVIPISGASEGFVPEDAEVLIEGTETGATLAANRLKVIERIFESTTCLIAHQGPVSDRRRRLRAEVVEMFRRSAAGARA
jgi:ATP phosphoribosyltransferase